MRQRCLSIYGRFSILEKGYMLLQAAQVREWPTRVHG